MAGAYVRAGAKRESAGDLWRLTLCHDGAADDEASLHVGEKLGEASVIMPLADCHVATSSTLRSELTSSFVGRIHEYTVEFARARGEVSIACGACCACTGGIRMASQRGKRWAWASHA